MTTRTFILTKNLDLICWLTTGYSVMVPAYDDPLLWQGHSSMIEEIARDIPRKPDAIFCSVGGAGMFGGVLVGCKNVGWDDGRCIRCS